MGLIVVVGAGPCGLVALKELREAGHQAVLFERSSTLGGVFSSSCIYPGLHLTISNWFMGFSDFPDPTRQQYSSADEYLQYLHSYARHFNLEQHIRYNSEICKASLDDTTGQWNLEIRQQPGHVTSHLQAAGLVVATGANQVPNTNVPGLEGFTGRVIHSSQFDDAFQREVAEKKLRVLVIGAGESGADVSSDLADLTPDAAVWLRRPPCIAPRFTDDRLKEMEHIARNKDSGTPVTTFLEASTTGRMTSGQNVYFHGLSRRLFLYLPGVDPFMSRFNLDSTVSAPLLTEQAAYVTKNARMLEAMAQSNLKVHVSPTMSAQGKTFTFNMADGSTTQREFDAVVLCTGFRCKFPWLQLPRQYGFEANPRYWYLHCFPPGLGDRLFFVGYARPHQGGIPALAEILCRYIAQRLLPNGHGAALPADYDRLALRDMSAEQRHFSITPNMHALVDYSSFLESVARRLGCEPRLPISCLVLFNLHMASVALLTLGCYDSRLNPLGVWLTLALYLGTLLSFFTWKEGLLIKWWFYPQWSIWYRLRGPGSDPSLVYDFLKRVPLQTSTGFTPFLAVFAVCSVPSYYLQRFLSLIVFIPYAILKALDVDCDHVWFGRMRPKQYLLHRCPWRFYDLLLP